MPDNDNIMSQIESPLPIKWESTSPTKIRDGIKRARQVTFLRAFAGCGVIKTSADTTGINYQTYRNWLNSDEWFRKHFKDAIEEYRDVISQEVHKRAIEGEQVPITGKVNRLLGNDADGSPIFGLEDAIIGYKTVKSDSLLKFHGRRFIHEYRDDYEEPKEDKPVETISVLSRITVRLDTIAARYRGALPAQQITIEQESHSTYQESPQLLSSGIINEIEE